MRAQHQNNQAQAHVLRGQQRGSGGGCAPVASSTARNLNRSQLGRSTQQQNNFYCVLCKKNGETELVYRNHKLRDENNQVVCPVLKQFTCPHCFARGDHTSGYCPMNPARKSPSSSSASSNNRKEFLKQQQQQPSRSSISSPSIILNLPHFCRPNCHLDYDRFLVLLDFCNRLKPEVRLEFLIKHGYNLCRFQRIQQIILAWRSLNQLLL